MTKSYKPAIDPCRVCGNDRNHSWEPSRDGSRVLVICPECRTILESYPASVIIRILEERRGAWKN